MLRIRPDQTGQFEQDAIEKFVRRAIAHLHKELSDRVIGKSDRDLAFWVHDIMKRAESFDLKTEQQIMCFLDAEALLGVRFYDDPRYAWAKELVRSKHLSPPDKAGLLLATACSVDRELRSRT
jgi:hypothetical protein